MLQARTERKTPSPRRMAGVRVGYQAFLTQTERRKSASQRTAIGAITATWPFNWLTTFIPLLLPALVFVIPSFTDLVRTPSFHTLELLFYGTVVAVAIWLSIMVVGLLLTPRASLRLVARWRSLPRRTRNSAARLIVLIIPGALTATAILFVAIDREMDNVAVSILAIVMIWILFSLGVSLAVLLVIGLVLARAAFSKSYAKHLGGEDDEDREGGITTLPTSVDG